MPQSSFAVVLLVTALVHVSRTLPISPNHRFAIYTPYWHQSSQPRIAPDYLQKRPNCDTDLCGTAFDPLAFPDRADDRSNILPITHVKRNNNMYKTGWTVGGMPFSVLYMNPPKPQITVRSPAEPLSHSYDNSEFPKEARFVDYPPAVQAQPLTSLSRSDPTVVPTRKQYSIIPQLFVSYGWGPLGK